MVDHTKPFTNLDETKDQIRILHLQPGIGDEPLVGILDVTTSSEAGKFDALS